MTETTATTTETKRDSALVLGASGGLGGEMVKALGRAGWQVRALTRGVADATSAHDGIQWLSGDAMQATDIMNAADGCAVIVHAVNPPYHRWSELVIPMLENTIAAARRNNALILLPGNVYNYGPDVISGGLPIAEDAPQNPHTKKGRIRAELEERLENYAADGGQVIIVRCGDFFGPNASNNWFAQGLVRPGKPVHKVTNPARPGVGHQWAYLPDVAQIMVQLLAVRSSLATFSRFHLEGFWDKDGTQMADAVCRVAEAEVGYKPAVSAFTWWLIRVLAPFNGTMRELVEMRYLWQQPVRMNNDRIIRTLGAEIQTPLPEAIKTTLTAMGCLQKNR